MFFLDFYTLLKEDEVYSYWFVCNVESSSVLQKRTRKIIFTNVSSRVIYKAHYQGRPCFLVLTGKYFVDGLFIVT